MTLQRQNFMSLTRFFLVLCACEFLTHAEDLKEEIGADTSASIGFANKRLFEERVAQEQEAHHTFLNNFERAMDDAIGADGQVEVKSLAGENMPLCKERNFLDRVFVHADGEMGSFICKPCHTLCTTSCWGPSRQDCAQALDNPLGKNHKSSETDSVRLSSEFARSFSSWRRSLKHGQHDGLAMLERSNKTSPDEACAKDHTCIVTDTTVAPVTQAAPPTEAQATLVVITKAQPAKVVSGSSLVTAVQQEVDKATKAVGLIGGLESGQGNVTENTHDATNENDGRKSNPEPDLEQLLQINDDETDQENETVQEKCVKRRQNRLSSHAVLSAAIKNLLLGMAKDTANIKDKKDKNVYAQTEIKRVLGAITGDCLDAVDMVLGFSQSIYSCWKDNLNLVDGMCKPNVKYTEAKVLVTSLSDDAVLVQTLSVALKKIPLIEKMVSDMAQVVKQAQDKIPLFSTMLAGMLVEDKGANLNRKCCKPFPESGCSDGVGADYKCASCSSGDLCTFKRVCNGFREIEAKVDAWKANFFDTFLINVAEAAKLNAGGLSSTDSTSTLAKECSIDTCSTLKAKVTSKIGAAKTDIDNKCPWTPPTPGLETPDFQKGRDAASTIAQVVQAFKDVGLALQKDLCFYIPDVSEYIEKKCEYICSKCCTNKWDKTKTTWWEHGEIKCHKCCYDVCVPVKFTKGSLNKYCSTKKEILSGTAKVPKKVLDSVGQDIMSEVDKILNGALKTRLGNVVGQLDDAIKPWKFPTPLDLDISDDLKDLPQKCW